MAPEQAMADPTTDHRADLYALGVVGYEMLAGQPPFSGRTAQQLIAAHATEAPVPLEQRRPSVPAALARLITRLLQKRAVGPAAAAPTRCSPHSSRSGTPAEGTETVVVRPASAPAHRRGWLAAGGVVAAALVLSLAFRDRRRGT